MLFCSPYLKSLRFLPDLSTHFNGFVGINMLHELKLCRCYFATGIVWTRWPNKLSISDRTVTLTHGAWHLNSLHLLTNVKMFRVMSGVYSTVLQVVFYFKPWFIIFFLDKKWIKATLSKNNVEVGNSWFLSMIKN